MAKPRITGEHLGEIYDDLWPTRQGRDLPGRKDTPADGDNMGDTAEA